MPEIIAVCTANICRSPVVEAVLRDRLAGKGLMGWRVQSAGTWAQNGQAPSRYGQEILAERGLDISSHTSQVITEELLQTADLVLCLETGHAEALRAEFPHHAAKIFLLTEMVGQRYSIADPYGGPRFAYERMIDDVTQLIEDGLPRIIELATNPE
jgi:protein-tyrosine phosphatase